MERGIDFGVMSKLSDDWHALADRFELGRIHADPAYVARGAMGEIWRLHTSAGRWAVKWQFPWAETGPTPADVPIQLAAAAAGITLPLPVVTGDGAAIIRIGDRHARVYEWMDLGDPLPRPAPAAVAAEAGRLLGLLHGLALHSDEPVDPWYTEVPGDDFWADLVDQVIAAGMPWAARLAAARPLIAELTEYVTPPACRTPVVCHRDFNPDNVFPVPGTARLAVLDWENAGPLDPVRELGYAVFAFCAASGGLDRTSADAMRAGYAAGLGYLPADGADFFATAVAAHLNVLQVMAERALSEPAHRESAEAFVADLLDQYLGELRLVIQL